MHFKDNCNPQKLTNLRVILFQKPLSSPVELSSNWKKYCYRNQIFGNKKKYLKHYLLTDCEFRKVNPIFAFPK